MSCPDSDLSASRRLIILGCGYIGRALAEAALRAGWTVEALTRSEASAARLRSELGLRAVSGDLADAEWHALLDSRGAWVVDCVSSGGGGIDGYRQAYLEGAESVREWLRRRPGVRGLLYTGSTSVYPQSGGDWVDDDAPTTASTPLNEILLQTESVWRKIAAEGLAPRVAILRLAGIYGPGRHHLIDRLRTGETVFPGPGDYYLNLIHRDDAAAALLALASSEQWSGLRVLNGADGNPATKAEIAAWTAARLGLPPPEFRPEAPDPRMRRRLLSDGLPPNRRIRATILRSEFGWSPRYADFRSGYAAILDEDSQPAEESR